MILSFSCSTSSLRLTSTASSNEENFSLSHEDRDTPYDCNSCISGIYNSYTLRFAWMRRVLPSLHSEVILSSVRLLSINDFIKDQAAASQLSSSTGIPYMDALRQVNYQTQQQRQAEEEAKKQQLARQASQQLLLDEMNKYAKAKLGEVPRSEMPQVCACDAEESDDIPTGKLEFVSPDKLKKTQEKINKTKARGIANDWANAGKEPVLISRDNWILDGHHRVEAAKTLGKLVRVVRVDLPGRKALTKLQELEEEMDS